MNRLMPAVFAFALLLAGCGTSRPAPAPLQAGETILVEANPAKGFNYPYLLHIPAEPVGGQTRLLVEPNNTGAVSDDPAVHLEAARKLSKNALGAYLSRKLNLPLLVPVFPRPKTDWQIYTHQLDRDSMLIAKGPMRRLDLQLVAMIDDAQRRLRSGGIHTRDGVLMTGFSASGTFTNRFTMLHPKVVHAAAMGGFNGLLIVPAPRSGDTVLPWPIGIADAAKLTGRRVDIAAWKRVPQFIYMGELDDNDALHFDDGYDDSERRIVYSAIGERMQPERWSRVQQIYRDAGANAILRTYTGIGHATDTRIASDLAEFFRQNL